MINRDHTKAFPSEHDSDKNYAYRNEGMDLRDYFAAKAMQGYMNDCYDMHAVIRAKAAYEQADAMMAAREAK